MERCWFAGVKCNMKSWKVLNLREEEDLHEVLGGTEKYLADEQSQQRAVACLSRDADGFTTKLHRMQGLQVEHEARAALQSLTAR